LPHATQVNPSDRTMAHLDMRAVKPLFFARNLGRGWTAVSYLFIHSASVFGIKTARQVGRGPEATAGQQITGTATVLLAQLQENEEAFRSVLLVKVDGRELFPNPQNDLTRSSVLP